MSSVKAFNDLVAVDSYYIQWSLLQGRRYAGSWLDAICNWHTAKLTRQSKNEHQSLA